MEERKRREGDEAMAAGAKCEKSGWFKSSDADGAAAAYERAATSYRVAKALPEAVDAYQRAAAAHAALELGGGSAAKLLEAAALLARDGLKAAANAADLFERASGLHAMDSVLDLAAAALCKAGRAVEPSDTKRACALMVRACALFDDEEDEPRLRGAPETFRAAASLLVRVGALVDAAALLRAQAPVYARQARPHDVSRAELSAVIVSLAAGEYERAATGCSQAEEMPDGFAGSDEAHLAHRFLEAFALQDEAALGTAGSDGTLAGLENQIALLARGFTLRSCRVPPAYLVQLSQKPSASGNAPAAGSGGAAASGAAACAGCAAGGAAAGSAVSGGTGDFGELAPEDAAEEEEEDDLC